MSVRKSTALWCWIGGLAVFAGSLVLHSPLAIESVPSGILDHQAAPDAATVDAIQGAWAEAGLIGRARMAMVSDLVFIAIYSVGLVLAGLYFRSREGGAVRALGWAAYVSGLMFFVTDMAETILQVIQLFSMQGSDTLAGIASICGPPKVVTFITGTLAVLIALALDRKPREGVEPS